LRGGHGEVESVHDPKELFANACGLFERTPGDEVFEAPVGVFLLTKVLVVDVEQGEMVPGNVVKVAFCFVGGLLGFFGTNEDVWDGEERTDGENFVRTTVLSARNQHFGELRVERKLGHARSYIGKSSFVVEGTKVVKKFEGTHECFRGGRIHKVEVYKIFDTEFLELEYDRAKIRTKNFRESLRLQV